MATRALETAAEEIVDFPMPISHLFRNTVPAPFSSFAWRHWQTEHVRRTARPVHQLSENPFFLTLSMLFSETGASVFTQRRARARRWQCIMAYCFFAIVISQPGSDGDATTTQHWMFMAFIVSTIAFLRAQSDLTSCMYGEAMAYAHAPAPTSILQGVPYMLLSAAAVVLCMIGYASMYASGGMNGYLIGLAAYVALGAAAGANALDGTLPGTIAKGDETRYQIKKVVDNKTTYKDTLSGLRTADKTTKEEADTHAGIGKAGGAFVPGAAASSQP